MAHIAFVSLYDRNANGIRLLCSALRQAGHQSSIIFLKPYELTRQAATPLLEEGEICWEGINENGGIFRFAVNKAITPSELDLLCNTLKQLDPDAVGMTVNTPLLQTAARVTRRIKAELDTPVIWGGIHPTIAPDTCVEFCDCACVGEGDRTILEIAAALDSAKDFRTAGNLTYLRDGLCVTNPMHPLERNLDLYPARDNTPEGKFFIDNNRIESSYARVNDVEPEGAYQTMTSRGCPYKCAYCCEASLQKLYAGQGFLRQRSVENVMAELVSAKQKLGIRKILFNDEVFSLSTRWLEEFIPLYKQQVNLPFDAYLYPSKGIERNLRLLKDGGLEWAVVALQSGSERINKDIFHRVYNREDFLHTVRLCKQIGIAFDSDVITYNPYEDETDLEQTLDVLMAMGGGYQITINKLFIMPHTELAKRVARDGIAAQNAEKDRLFNYYCRLFYVATYFRNPRPLVGLIKALGIFRSHPALLRPSLIRTTRHPVAPARAVVGRILPAGVKRVLKHIKRKLQPAGGATECQASAKQP